MDKDLSRTGENHLPADKQAAQPKCSEPARDKIVSDELTPGAPRRNFFLEGIARIIQSWKPKRFISFRLKVTRKDVLSVETEFIYRDDSRDDSQNDSGKDP